MARPDPLLDEASRIDLAQVFAHTFGNEPRAVASLTAESDKLHINRRKLPVLLKGVAAACANAGHLFNRGLFGKVRRLLAEGWTGATAYLRSSFDETPLVVRG
eukprot:2742571-Lingulodinium_polyedra.AAC.1